MEINLSNTWIVAQMGSSSYCVNSEYVKGLSELNKAEYSKPVAYSGIMKGIYKVYDTNLPVLDGRRMLGYTSIDEEKLNFSDKIHSLKYKHISFLDELEWSILTHDTFDKSLKIEESELWNWIKATKFNEKKLNLTIQNIETPLKVYYELANKALKSSKSSNLSISNAHALLAEIKRQSELYIIKSLNALIEIHNKSIIEMCIVIRCKGLDFGVSVDKIISISEQSGDISKECKDRFSAGTVKIKDVEHNILNSTKITKLIKEQEV